MLGSASYTRIVTDRGAALKIANAMPLVHYPANARFGEWFRWGGLASPSHRGLAPEPGPFNELRNAHVFVYAGPCCYYHDECIGDAVIYFAAGAEAGRVGSATPFDSGALEDDPPRLQPFRCNRTSELDRWSFFVEHRVALADWRMRFAEWLAHCYDDPNRYMDSDSDRYAAGEPDRTQPPELLEHNGTRGRDQHGIDECGDRRTWTWEVRVESTLPFESIAVLHVPFHAIEYASQFVDEMNHDGQAQIRPLARDVIVSADIFYQFSGSILRELIGP